MTLPTTDPFVGEVFEGRYLVEELIARGGMANVYRATDLKLSRTVALKILASSLANDPSFVDRFMHEAKASAALMHPNVVAVHDQGLALGYPFLVMEYVPGKTIREVLARFGPLTSAHALEIMKSVLAGLWAAHEAGFVHRDIKPENVLITNDGQIKVTDFGLARVITEQVSTTNTGAVLLGTMAYLSPEQVSQQPIDARSDVYSSGILLFEMVTGKVPFTGNTPLDVAYKHVHEDVPAPSVLQPDVPPAVDHLVLAATARNINNRLASARAFQDGVNKALSAVPQAESLITALPLDSLPPLRVTQPKGGQIESPIKTHDSMPPLPSNAKSHSLSQAGFFKQKQKSILALFGLIATILFATFMWFNFSGNFQTVPQLEQKSVEQLSQELTALGLNVELIDSYSEEVAAGQIINTEPNSGKRANVNEPVKIFISLGPERFVIPIEIIGKNQTDAEQIIADLNLVFDGTEEVFAETIEIGKVSGTIPAPGTSLKRDTPVKIQISKGAEPIEVPNVVGLKVDEAVQILQDAGFIVEQVKRFPIAPLKIVYSQNPAANSKVTKGSVITIQII